MWNIIQTRWWRHYTIDIIERVFGCIISWVLSCHSVNRATATASTGNEICRDRWYVQIVSFLFG